MIIAVLFIDHAAKLRGAVDLIHVFKSVRHFIDEIRPARK